MDSLDAGAEADALFFNELADSWPDRVTAGRLLRRAGRGDVLRVLPDPRPQPRFTPSDVAATGGFPVVR